MLNNFGSIIGSAMVPAKEFSAFSHTVDRLTHAASLQQRVRIRYYSLHRNADTERTVDPYAIYFDPDGATLKLIGYDNFRSRITQFAVDHIKSLRETTERFKRPANFKLQEFLTNNCFNGIHGDLVTVRLRGYGVTARIFAERSFHPSQRVVESIALTPSSLSSRGSRRQNSTKASKTKRSEPVDLTDEHTKTDSRESSESALLESTTIEMRVAGGRGLLRFVLSWVQMSKCSTHRSYGSRWPWPIATR